MRGRFDFAAVVALAMLGVVLLVLKLREIGHLPWWFVVLPFLPGLRMALHDTIRWAVRRNQ